MSEQDPDQAAAPRTEKPEPTEEHVKQAEQQAEAYTEDRPTAVMPGTGGTVTGTAVNDWLDDQGNPKTDTAARQDDSHDS